MDTSWSSSVPSTVPLLLPAVGKVGVRARPRPLLRSRYLAKGDLSGGGFPSFRGAIALCLRLYLALHCSTFHSACAVATVGMVGTPEDGTPCTKARVWQLSVFLLRLARPLCSTRVSHAQQVCDDYDPVNLFRKFAFFKRELVQTLY